MIFNGSLSLYLMILELHKHVVNHKLLILKGNLLALLGMLKSALYVTVQMQKMNTITFLMFILELTYYKKAQY